MTTLELSSANSIEIDNKDVSKIEIFNTSWETVWEKKPTPPSPSGQFKLVFQFPSASYVPEQTAEFEVILYKNTNAGTEMQGILRNTIDEGIIISGNTITCMFSNMIDKTEIGQIQINYINGSRQQTLSISPIQLIVVHGEEAHFYYTRVQSTAEFWDDTDLFYNFTSYGELINNIDFDDSEITLYIDQQI